MNRLGMIAVLITLLSVSAFAQDGPRELAGVGASAAPVERPQAQLQRQITALYLSNFKEEVGLSDEQFLKVEPVIRNFIGNRFRVANARRDLDERQRLLLSQPNPSEAEIQKLNEELTSLDEVATQDARFMRNLQPQLSERQLLAARQFHRTFINEKLPRALEVLRAQTAPRGQQQRPAAASGNPQNRRQPAQPARPGNALRGRNQPAPARR